MKQRINNWLQIKVFAGLGVMLFGSAAIVAYLNLLSVENYANQELLSYVRQLDVQGQAIKRRGSTYATHAPRDFAPYERDLIIFYPNFMHDLEAFEQQIIRIAKTEKELPRNILHSSDNNLRASIQNLQSNWLVFRQGFQEKLGTNPDEPRLEWGADYVQENQELINSITGMLVVTIDNAIQNQLKVNNKLSNIAMAGAGALLVLVVIWFYFKIIHRISLTIKGCQRVAQGDFGYQLPTRGNDELSALAMAFNTLSARTRFVLNMLTKMHNRGSAESKVDSLWNEAGDYLPIQWLGLWELNPTDNSLKLMSMRSDRPMPNTLQQSLINAAENDQHLLSMTKEHSPVKYDNLSDLTNNLANAKLVREILKLGLLKSELIVPLTSDNGWKGLLVFVATDAAAYTDEHLELIGNLSPYMANGFSQAKR
jgi:hypothetical protein